MSGDEIKGDEVCRVCDIRREKRSAYRILIGKSEGKRHLEGLSGGEIIILN
jgi:hypothetical protein